MKLATPIFVVVLIALVSSALYEPELVSPVVPKDSHCARLSTLEDCQTCFEEDDGNVNIEEAQACDQLCSATPEACSIFVAPDCPQCLEKPGPGTSLLVDA